MKWQRNWLLRVVEGRVKPRRLTAPAASADHIDIFASLTEGR